MSYSDNSLLRPRSRYELKRRYFHRGYLWPWILVLLIPFVLRFAVFYDVTFLFQPSPSTTEHERPEELQLYKFPEGSPDGVEIPIINDSQVVHPGHGARITYDDRISNVDDRVENDPSHGRTENERPTARHLPLPKRPDEQDTVDVNLGFPEENEDNIEGVVDEVQLRQIGEQIQAIKRWENWEERSRWNGEQEVVNDQLEAGQGNEEKKAKELKTTEEKLATEVRKPADTDEGRAVEESMVAAETEAEEDSKIVEELESSDTRTAARKQNAAEERRAANEMEVEVDGQQQVAGELEAAEVRRDIEERMAARDAQEERKLEEEVEAEEERRAAEERDAEEELMAAKDREAQEKEADQQWTIEERTVDELQEAGGKKNGEAEESAEEKRESNESRNDDEQNQDAKQTDGEEKNSSEVEEQKTTNDQEQEERTVELDEPIEEGTEDQNHENGKEEKDEAIHEDSDQTYGEDSTIPIDHTHGASLAAGECDLFDGDWEYDPEGPLYTNSTCFFIRGDHNCMSNGRPDTDYLNWRWKPRGCDLPRFDARAFMEAFTGKTIGFIGDSLARNQMQSMLCMLSLVEVPIQLHDDGVTARWLYEQHQVTLAVVWSPYLLQESQEGVMGFEKGQSVLYLDVLDPAWTSMLPDCDIIVLSVGQWYFKPSVYVMQEEVIGCHYCPNLNLTEIGLTQSYSEGLRRALERVAKDWKGIAILSSFASAHGERGPADEGDQCRRERPLDKKEWESSFRGMQNEMHEIVLGEFNRMVNDKSKINNDLHIEFLDVSTLSLLRADGHPGAYYYAHPYEGKSPDEWVFNDCLHWCLPGPIDTWNHLLVKISQKYL